MDIIVTTPKSQMANAAQEAADCIENGGGEYFRRFHSTAGPQKLGYNDRVYYVEDGYVRGFAVVARSSLVGQGGMRCETTGRVWSQGLYVFMPADSWQWILPVPMKGFQGFRYVAPKSIGEHLYLAITRAEIVGGWRDPKPDIVDRCPRNPAAGRGGRTFCATCKAPQIGHCDHIEPPTERLTGGDQLTADVAQPAATQADAESAESGQ